MLTLAFCGVLALLNVGFIIFVLFVDKLFVWFFCIIRIFCLNVLNSSILSWWFLHWLFAPMISILEILNFFIDGNQLNWLVESYWLVSEQTVVNKVGKTCLFRVPQTFHSILTDRWPESFWTNAQLLLSPLRCNARGFHVVGLLELRNPLQNFMQTDSGEFSSFDSSCWLLIDV